MSLLKRTFLTLCTVGLYSTPLFGQEPDATRIDTVDGVRLNAVFYPSPKKNSPTIIMVHPIGEGKSIRSQDWKNLAAFLQKKEFSVMMFDFRGHGDSTTIQDPNLFWSQLANRNLLRSKSKEVIDVKDFIKTNAYLPILVNDLAAVKAYLDRKNDDGACNTSNTIVIAAESGAALASIWINSEWYRYKFTPANFMLMQPARLDKKSQGQDIVAAIFLSATPNLNAGRTINVSGTLGTACKVNGMPTIFFSGEDDAKATNFAKTLEKNLKVAKSKKHDYIGAVPLKTNLSGVKLLQKGLKTDDAIAKWLDNVVLERGSEHYARDFQKSLFMWVTPFAKTPAKTPLEKNNLRFDTYEKFIAR